MFALYLSLIVLIAYLIGAIPFGLIVARMAGNIDIRQHGSGNIGATNVGRVLGKKWGILVFLLDFIKGYGPVFGLVLLLAHLSGADLLHLNIARVAAGAGAIIGHMFPVYLKFKGGKGVATAAGVLGAIDWLVVLLVFILWVVIVYLTKYVSLASMIAGLAVCGLYMGLRHDMAFNDGMPITVFLSNLSMLVIIKHRSNIVRLVKGTENKVWTGTRKEVAVASGESSGGNGGGSEQKPGAERARGNQEENER